MDIRPRRPLLVSESHVFRKIAWVNSIQSVNYLVDGKIYND